MFSNRFYDELAAIIVSQRSTKETKGEVEKGMDDLAKWLTEFVLPKDIEGAASDKELDNGYALYNELNLPWTMNDPKLVVDNVLTLLAANHADNGYELTLTKYELQKRGVSHVMFSDLEMSEDALFHMLYNMILNYDVPKIVYNRTLDLNGKLVEVKQKFKRLLRLGPDAAKNEIGLHDDPRMKGKTKDLDMYSVMKMVNELNKGVTGISGKFLFDDQLQFGCYANVGTANSGKQLINSVILSATDINVPVTHISCGERADVLISEQMHNGIINESNILTNLNIDEYKLYPDVVDLVRFMLDQKQKLEDKAEDSSDMNSKVVDNILADESATKKFFTKQAVALATGNTNEYTLTREGKMPIKSIIVINSITSVLNTLSSKGASKAGINKSAIDKFYAMMQFFGERTNTVIVLTHRVDRNELEAGLINMILGNTWGLFINSALLQDPSLINSSDESFIRINKFRFINKQAKAKKLKFTEVNATDILTAIGDLKHN